MSETKICKMCDIEKSVNDFHKNRAKCKKCFNQERSEKGLNNKKLTEDEIKNIPPRICKLCNIKKPITEYPGKRWQCKKCVNERKNLKNNLNPLPPPKITDNTKICSCCKIEKIAIEYKKGSNQCKECDKVKRKKLNEKKKHLLNTLDLSDKQICSKCDEEKTIGEFYTGEKTCKQCRNKMKENRLKLLSNYESKFDYKICKYCDQKKDIKLFRTGESTCKECAKEMLYTWRKKNPEKFSSINKKYREKPEIKEKAKQYKKNSYLTNPNEKITRIYRSKLRNFVFKNSQSKKNYIFGCDRRRFLHWIQFNMTPQMTWDNYGKYWHLDHIKPCSSFDLENQDDLKECFNWSNTTPCLVKDNLIKFDKIEDETLSLYRLRVLQFEKIYKKKLQYEKHIMEG